MARTIKVNIDGKEHEIEVPKEYVLQTELLSNDELFKEALEMRGIKLDGGSNPTPNNANNSANDEIIKQLAEQVKALSAALQEEKKAREEATQRLQQDAERQRAKEIENTLAQAIKDGRITPEQKDSWKARLEKDFEAFSQTLNELPPNPALNNDGKDGNNKSQDQQPGGNLSTGDPILDAVKQHNASAVIPELN